MVAEDDKETLMSKQCRTCLTITENMKTLKDKIAIREKDITICDVIMQCASIQISEEDPFPNNICNVCIDQASVSYIFKQKVEDSQRVLLKQLVKHEATPEKDCSTEDEYTKTDNIISDSENSDDDKKKFECKQCDAAYVFRRSLQTHMRKVHSKSAKNKKGGIKSKPARFYCTVCDASFTKNRELLKHVRAKHSDAEEAGEISPQKVKVLKCCQCSDVFTTQYLYKIHIREVHDNKDYNSKCIECSEEFKSVALLEKHHVLHRSYNCKICSKEFNQPVDLHEHLASHDDFNYSAYFNADEENENGTPAIVKIEEAHFSDGTVDSKSLICQKCDLTFENIAQLTTHLACHPPYTCLPCGVTYYRIDSYRCHMRRKHANDRPKIKVCIECDQQFDTTKALHDHYATHKRFHCKKCPNSYATVKLLRRHQLEFCKPSQVDSTEVYQCSTCNAQFTTRSELLQHKKQHRDQYCEYCGLKMSQNSLRKHMERHMTAGNFACVVCGEKFNNPGALDDHQATHDDYKCNDCHTAFDSRDALRKHLDQHSFERLCPQSNECLECALIFESREELLVHHSTHVDFTCQECGNKYNTAAKLLLHMDKHNRAEASAARRTCQICGKVYKHPAHMRVHMRGHHGQDPSHPLTCDYCDFTATGRAPLARHMHVEHEDFKNIFCTVCNKGFFSKKNLGVHMLVHSGIKRHVCEVCGRSFALSNNLKAHMRVHSGEKPYRCETCGKTYAQYSSLRSHMVFHSSAKDHVCSVCGSRFARKGGLLIHMRRHSAEKTHECTACSKRFKTNEEMKRHALTHTGIRNFVCTVCGKAFNRNSNLTVHMRIHTGETPHVCAVCGKGFIQAHCLRGHMKTHT